MDEQEGVGALLIETLGDHVDCIPAGVGTAEVSLRNAMRKAIRELVQEYRSDNICPRISGSILVFCGRKFDVQLFVQPLLLLAKQYLSLSNTSSSDSSTDPQVNPADASRIILANSAATDDTRNVIAVGTLHCDEQRFGTFQTTMPSTSDIAIVRLCKKLLLASDEIPNHISLMGASEPSGESVAKRVAALRQRLVPAVARADILELESILGCAQKTDIAHRSEFVASVNRILSATGLCIRTKSTGELSRRLWIDRNGFICLQCTRGNMRGFKNAELEIISYNTHRKKTDMTRT